MKVAVVGSGGREHALLRALYDSTSGPDCLAPSDRPECLAIPGNDGMTDVARRVPGNEVDPIVEALDEEDVDLCVVGPESYLEQGLADRCRETGIPCWGPVRASAQLETSKRFAKQFMNRHGIPTGDYEVAEGPEDIQRLVDEYPTVLKYDALAGGKGVTVCTSPEDVDEYIEEVYRDKRFGSVEPVLVEEHLDGVELTVICAVCDGDYQMFPASRDYKRLQDGDRGPNTGGMGAVSSRELIQPSLLNRVEQEIIQPTIDGLQEDDMDYRGFLYFGLMLTEEGPHILEYNCRFGDPEAQATLPLVEGRFDEYLLAGSQGTLNPDLIEFNPGWSVCVMAASGGYPYESGDGEVIQGLEDVREARVYHSGTERDADGAFRAVGGRVLGIVAVDSDRTAARSRAYDELEKVHFEGMQTRGDIAQLHFQEPTPGAS